MPLSTRCSRCSYPDQPAASSLQFVQRVLEGGRRVSMAQVQGYLMFYKVKSEPHMALENVQALWTL